MDVRPFFQPLLPLSSATDHWEEFSLLVGDADISLGIFAGLFASSHLRPVLCSYAYRDIDAKIRD